MLMLKPGVRITGLRRVGDDFDASHRIAPCLI
jgi:hypothetical protein